MLDLLSRCQDIELVDGGRAAGADVVLSLDGRFRPRRTARTVTAVLDLGHLLERTGYGLGEWLRQNWRVASAVRSDHLLAPSGAVAFGLERYLRVAPDRITVITAPPRPGFRRPPRERVADVRTALGLPERYFVCVGSRARRKNLGLLAGAWAAASVRLGPGVGLVLAGPGPRGRAVPGAIDVGFVDAADLPALISGAIAWLGPSLYEGSPTGAMEAMACGTPPLVAAGGAPPKAVGPAGLVLDAHDPAQWASAMVAVAGDARLRSRLSVASLAAAAAVRSEAPPLAALEAALRGTPAAAR